MTNKPAWILDPHLMERGVIALMLDNEDGDGICTIDVKGAKGLAIAHLIAAAPDLLEALKDLREWAALMGDWDAPAWAAAEAAIKRAEGEA